MPLCGSWKDTSPHFAPEHRGHVCFLLYSFSLCPSSAPPRPHSAFPSVVFWAASILDSLWCQSESSTSLMWTSAWTLFALLKDFDFVFQKGRMCQSKTLKATWNWLYLLSFKNFTGFTVHNWSLIVTIKNIFFKVLNRLKKKKTTKILTHLFSIQ